MAVRFLLPVAVALVISACGRDKAPDEVGFVPAAEQDSGADSVEAAAEAAPTDPGVNSPAPAVPGPRQPAAGTPTQLAASRSSAPAPSAPSPAGPAPAVDNRCPGGAPVGQITYFRATAQPGLGGDLTVWIVTARGTVTNKATAAVQIPVVDIKVSGTLTFDIMTASLNATSLAPGQTAKWETTTITQSGKEPTPALVLAGKWSWMDAALKACPAG